MEVKVHVIVTVCCEKKGRCMLSIAVDQLSFRLGGSVREADLAPMQGQQLQFRPSILPLLALAPFSVKSFLAAMMPDFKDLAMTGSNEPGCNQDDGKLADATLPASRAELHADTTQGRIKQSRVSHITNIYLPTGASNQIPGAPGPHTAVPPTGTEVLFQHYFNLTTSPSAAP